MGNRPSATVCLPYSDADVLQAGGEVLNFVIGFFDGALWQPLPPVESTVAGLACGETDHFTEFGLLARVPTQLPATGAGATGDESIAGGWLLLVAALITLAGGVWIARKRVLSIE